MIISKIISNAKLPQTSLITSAFLFLQVLLHSSRYQGPCLVCCDRTRGNGFKLKWVRLWGLDWIEGMSFLQQLSQLPSGKTWVQRSAFCKTQGPHTALFRQSQCLQDLKPSANQLFLPLTLASSRKYFSEGNCLTVPHPHPKTTSTTLTFKTTFYLALLISQNFPPLLYAVLLFPLMFR